MVQYMMRVALAGGAFLAIQLWNKARGKMSYDRYMAEKETPSGQALLTLDQYLLERKRALGTPDRLLSVSNFGLKQMEGARAPPNK